MSKKNANGNQQTAASSFNLQSLKYISYHQGKKKKQHKKQNTHNKPHEVLNRAVCWNGAYLPLAVIDLFFPYKL